MSRAWMPMYWGDYLADTHHFTAAQHGSYLLLIGFYWCNGGLPHDENEIRQIAKCDIARWPKLKKVLLRKFTEELENDTPVWKHMRIDREIAKSLEKSRINSANAKRKPSEVAGVSPTQSQSQSQKKDKKKKASLSSMPADWMPGANGIAAAEAAGWDLAKTTAELARFKDHALAHNRKQADWAAAWRNWITSPYQQTNGNGGYNGRQLQDDRLSVSKAAERLLAQPDLQIPPRPDLRALRSSLVPGASSPDCRLLPKGRST